MLFAINGAATSFVAIAGAKRKQINDLALLGRGRPFVHSAQDQPSLIHFDERGDTLRTTSLRVASSDISASRWQTDLDALSPQMPVRLYRPLGADLR